ncbi:hypothetical protein PV343_06860 [Streptomyces sp. WI03-4A]|uniref:hypothetical protein n=1 Tax=Streptomyces sp. WI03-4A TaxID=3028706 RepID=UPI0029B8C4F9|nr:hypothetical protein [Streptomyces sp. WI03-4A]MDX2591983.1 hypothetical protein [Streptomyces sp. WI03-4A]
MPIRVAPCFIGLLTMLGRPAEGHRAEVEGLGNRRYERKAERFLAFAGIASALICYRRLAVGTGHQTST